MKAFAACRLDSFGGRGGGWLGGWATSNLVLVVVVPPPRPPHTLEHGHLPGPDEGGGDIVRTPRGPYPPCSLNGVSQQVPPVPVVQTLT